LSFVVEDIPSEQTIDQEIDKSRGKNSNEEKDTAAEIHAALRLAGGFDIGQMISEYRALRSSVIKLWRASKPPMDDVDFLDMTRFNEAIDQALAESAGYYSKKTLKSKDLFVGILSHDIRNPLQAISLSAELLINSGLPSPRHAMLARAIEESAERISGLIKNLIDVTRARLGSGLQIVRSRMDMGLVGHQIVDEVRTTHPENTIVLDLTPNLIGDWDKARIGQVFANLIGNAVQYGFRDYPIHVAVAGDPDAVTINVHNHGNTIHPDRIGGVFDPLRRAVEERGDNAMSVNLGLGLFIAHEIVVAHGGTITVTSLPEEGTTFTARFPRTSNTALSSPTES
jgi:signal transduction histidine kinase